MYTVVEVLSEVAATVLEVDLKWNEVENIPTISAVCLCAR